MTVRKVAVVEGIDGWQAWIKYDSDIPGEYFAELREPTPGGTVAYAGTMGVEANRNYQGSKQDAIDAGLSMLAWIGKAEEKPEPPTPSGVRGGEIDHVICWFSRLARMWRVEPIDKDGERIDPPRPDGVVGMDHELWGFPAIFNMPQLLQWIKNVSDEQTYPEFKDVPIRIYKNVSWSDPWGSLAHGFEHNQTWLNGVLLGKISSYGAGLGDDSDSDDDDLDIPMD